MNDTAEMETEFTRAKTSVWWDIENCCVPKGCDARGIAQTLSSALTKMNYFGPLSISSYGNTNLIPNFVQLALSSTGISLNHVPSGRKDASDKKILTDMLLWVVDNPAPANIMLITADGDFSDALHKLRMRRYNILLAHPEDASASLVACAKTTWIWRSLWPSVCPPSLTLCDDGQAMDSLSDTTRTVRNNKLKGIYVPKPSNLIMQHEATRKNIQWQLKQNLELLGEPREISAAPSECHEASAHCGASCSVVCSGKAFLDSNPKNANIQDIVEDNSHQFRDAQESMKYLEKQSPLMETCVTSEWSGREFWQDFKGKLESQSGAPLSVDCVFSELTRDFRVPKEVREYFEAILKKPEPSKDEIVIEKLECMPEAKHGLEMKSGEPGNEPVGPCEHLNGDMNKKKRKPRKKKSKVTEDGAEAYVCSLCSVVCACPTVFESHLKGRKHAAMIKKQHTEALLDDEQIQEDISEDNGRLIEMIEGLRFQPGEALENIDYLEWQNKELRETVGGIENENKYLQIAEGIFFEHKPEFSATKEARESSDDIIKKLDISGNLTRELEDLPKQNLEMSWNYLGGTSAGATGHPSEYMDKNKNEVTEDKDKPEAYVCGICNVSSDCPTVFESHLIGRIHAANLKKHAELLIDDKQILEESL